MSRYYIIFAILLSIIFITYCSSPNAIQSKIASQPETSELYKAVSIAMGKTVNLRKSRGEIKLISAQQIIVKGKYIWRITLKPVNLLPKDPSTKAVGLGGEIFINVDLKTDEAKVTFGE